MRTVIRMYAPSQNLGVSERISSVWTTNENGSLLANQELMTVKIRRMWSTHSSQALLSCIPWTTKWKTFSSFVCGLSLNYTTECVLYGTVMSCHPHLHAHVKTVFLHNKMNRGFLNFCPITFQKRYVGFCKHNGTISLLAQQKHLLICFESTAWYKTPSITFSGLFETNGNRLSH